MTGTQALEAVAFDSFVTWMAEMEAGVQEKVAPPADYSAGLGWCSPTHFSRVEVEAEAV